MSSSGWLHGHTNFVRCLCLVRPNVLASGGEDGTVRVWDVEARDAVRVVKIGDEVLSLCRVDDSTIAAGGGYEAGVAILNVDTGEVVQRIEEHQRPVHSMAMVGPSLLMVGEESAVTLRNLSTGEVLFRWEEEMYDIRCISPVDARTVAVTANIDEIWLLDIETGGVVQTLTGHAHEVYALCMASPHLLVSGSTDASVRVWDVRTGALLRVLCGHTDEVDAVCLVRPGVVASKSMDGSIRFWRLDTGETVHIIRWEWRHHPEHRETAFVSSMIMLDDRTMASARISSIYRRGETRVALTDISSLSLPSLPPLVEQMTFPPLSLPLRPAEYRGVETVPFQFRIAFALHYYHQGLFSTLRTYRREDKFVVSKNLLRLYKALEAVPRHIARREAKAARLAWHLLEVLALADGRETLSRTLVLSLTRGWDELRLAMGDLYEFEAFEGWLHTQRGTSSPHHHARVIDTTAGDLFARMKRLAPRLHIEV